MGKGGADYNPFSSVGGGQGMLQASKWTSFAVSCLTALAGVALIGIGVYGLLNPLGSAMVPMTLPIISIAVGSAVILISVLGSLSSFAEMRTALWCYFWILLAFILLQYIIGIVALSTRGDAIDELADRRWNYLYFNRPKYLRDIQENYECCGLNYLDDRAYPKPERAQDKCSRHPDFAYQRPCIGPIKEEWSERQKVFGITILSLGALQLLGLLPIYYLATRIPTEEERDHARMEEHRRLLERFHGPGGEDGRSTPTSYGGLRGDLPAQHQVGGPAGSFPYPAKRPGSRV
ncbi:Tetraspanin family-domain-containing protein [Fimicolochytrium jonesii]|uniref:Tetraspanin family-domain-containing protein n=1 Tax=Fimicolochytrium jonesii TaxID=1396493 RepID=UPI0022FF36EE|nr:Tetraspanin family-domain-containing protein [Fimicolochytrium jonesii]KAI8817379.1 Tetraspanin family-domain-containing protein [Fimicolochytrium jonesii]